MRPAMSLVYLYTYRLPVQLSMTNHSQPNYNRPMINYNIRVYKNNTNAIEFWVRNNDRKSVRLIDCAITVMVCNVETGTVVLEKAAEILDEINGKARLVLLADDVKNWLVGGYSYNVRLTQPDGVQEFLYTDINNNATGYFELLDSVGGTLVPAQTLLWSQLTPQVTDWYSWGPMYVSGAIPSTNQVGNNTGLFSAALYQDHWSGTFKVQASLANLVPTEQEWFDVSITPQGATVRYLGTQSGVVCYTWSGNVRWFRFVFVPDSQNTGTVSQIIYKIT